MSAKLGSDHKRDTQGIFIEVIGVPGSGKSTLIKQCITQNSTYKDQGYLLRKAAFHQLKKESLKGWLLAYGLGGAYARQRYFATDVHARRFLRENPELAERLSAWFVTLPSHSGVQQLGRMVSLNSALSTAKLIDGFPHKQIVLFDEHWLQLITVVLNDGDERAYMDWFEQVVSLVTWPDGVIWLTDASPVAAARQTQRGKVATLLEGSSDIIQTSREIERRMAKPLEVLQAKNLPVLKLKATASVTVNAQAVHEWMQGWLVQISNQP